MSLSPFDSFQSRFVTYLLNRPRSFVPVNNSLHTAIFMVLNTRTFRSRIIGI